MHKLTRRLPVAGDGGFTLVELLLAVVIIGVIAVPLGSAILGFLTNTDATTARYTESHDAQITATYFVRDVAGLGARDWTNAAGSYPYLQSVELDAPAAGGLYPCGAASLPNAAVRLAWDDYTGLPDPTTGGTPPPTTDRVAYVVETVGTEQQLHRLTCAGSSSVTSDAVVAHRIVSVSVACSTSCTGAGSSLPQSVSLTLVLHDPKSRTANYTVALTGQRRQS